MNAPNKTKMNLEERRAKYLTDPTSLYSRRYFANRTGSIRKWEIQAGMALSYVLNIKSLIDIGCGLGSYLEGALQARTKKVIGIDVCYDLLKDFIPEYVRKFIHKGHAGKKLDYGKWDCSLSIDVVEHLLPEQEDMFVSNLVGASSRLVVMTGGYKDNEHHLNTGKRKPYWVNRLLDMGCTRAINKEQALAEAWTEVAKGYTRRNVIVAEINSGS